MISKKKSEMVIALDTEKILELCYDHYKDTNELNRAAQSRRNRDFMILCILEAISLLMVWNPQFIAAVINDVVRSQIENTMQIGSNVLQTLIWILIAYILVRYIQEVMYIERQYDYLNKLENRINDLLAEKDITREGDSYLQNFPLVLNIIHLFYNLFCPIFFTFINIYHIILEWKNVTGVLSIAADSIICFSIILITLFYYFEIHTRTRKFFLKCKLISWMDNTIRNWLKGV